MQMARAAENEHSSVGDTLGLRVFQTAIGVFPPVFKKGCATDMSHAAPIDSLDGVTRVQSWEMLLCLSWCCSLRTSLKHKDGVLD